MAHEILSPSPVRRERNRGDSDSSPNGPREQHANVPITLINIKTRGELSARNLSRNPHSGRSPNRLGVAQSTRGVLDNNKRPTGSSFKGGTNLESQEKSQMTIINFFDVNT